MVQRLLLKFCNCASNTVFMKELCLLPVDCDETLSGRSWEFGRSTTVIQLEMIALHTPPPMAYVPSIDACLAFIFAWYPRRFPSHMYWHTVFKLLFDRDWVKLVQCLSEPWCDKKLPVMIWVVETGITQDIKNNYN